MVYEERFRAEIEPTIDDTAVAATGVPGGALAPPLFAKMKFAHLYFTVLR